MNRYYRNCSDKSFIIKKTIYAITKPKTKSIKERSQNEKLSKSSRKNGASKNCSPSVTVSSSTHTNGHIPSRDIADRPPLPLPDFAMPRGFPLMSAVHTIRALVTPLLTGRRTYTLPTEERDGGYCVCGIRTIQSVLIQGWTVHRSSEPSSFGRLYYINERENAIGWELPPEIEEQLSHELRVMLRNSNSILPANDWCFKPCVCVCVHLGYTQMIDCVIT